MKKSRTPSPAGRKLTIENGTGFNATTNWLMAGLVLSGAVCAHLFIESKMVLDLDSPDFDPLAFLPLAIACFGTGYLVLAIRDTLVGRKSGDTVLEIEGDRVELGGTLKGVIRSANGVAPTGDYVINVQCIESILSTSSISNRRNTDHLRWEATRRVDPKSVDARSGIPVQFDLPASALATGDTRAKGSVRWVLDIKAPQAGTDFYAIFVFAVQPPFRK